MESESNIFIEKPNIFIENFNKYKKYIYPIFYLCMFLFTLFVSLLIIFQKVHKDNINLIYFYLTFCIGLFFLLGLLAFRQDLLSFILFFIYVFYSFIYLFFILRFDYTIYFKSIPLFTALILLGFIIGCVVLWIIGEICYANHTTNMLPYFVGINIFSLLFLTYYFLTYVNYIPTLSADNNYSYVSFYKLYVFIMCIFYFLTYIFEFFNNDGYGYEKYVIYFFLCLMLLGLMLYVVRINGKTSISLKVFLWLEYTPIFLATLFAIGKFIQYIYEGDTTIFEFVKKLSGLFAILTIVSLLISWFVYFYDSKPRLLSINQMVTWNFCNLFLISIFSCFSFQLNRLGGLLFVVMLFLLGPILFFCKFMNVYGLTTYYSILFLLIFIVGISLFFIDRVKLRNIFNEFKYGSELVKISYSSIFKICMVLIIVITLLSLANLTYKSVETIFILTIVCGLPVILFYLFYSSNKKATDSNFFMSCVKMLKEAISIFIKNLGNLLILFFILILTIICLYNVICNKYSSLDIYFLGYFFFLVLYILYYFPEFVKGNFGSEKMVRQVTLINLVLFFSAIIIYYILYGLGYVTQGISNTSALDASYSQTIYYLILFVFLAFIYLYYRNNLSSSTNPYLNLVINILFYIPCLFVNIIEYIQSQMKEKSGPSQMKEKSGPSQMKEKSGPSQMKEKSGPYFIILGIEIFLVLFYGLTIYLQTKQSTQGGISLIHDPLNLNIDTPLSVPDSNLYQSTKPFALSFWFYINSQSLTTNKYYNLLNYQYRPQVLYNPKLNTLFIDVSGNTWETSYLNTYNVNNSAIEISGNEVVVDISNNQYETTQFPGMEISGNEIILDPKYQTTGVVYINNNVLLQKWNHLVINYNGSVMDIFLNGKLVKSSPQILPNIPSLSLFDVGQPNGIDGGICNLMFYKHTLSYSSVNTIYQSVKDLDPPVASVYWDSSQKKVESSKLNKLKEEYKFLNI